MVKFRHFPPLVADDERTKQEFSSFPYIRDAALNFKMQSGLELKTLNEHFLLGSKTKYEQFRPSSPLEVCSCSSFF